jgi:hypothetical protein
MSVGLAPPCLEKQDQPRRFRSGRLATRALAASLFLALGAATILFRYNPSEFGFYPVCLFHKTTGLLCPGCGVLRASHQLLHGHIGAAFQLNALFVLGLPIVAWHFGRVAIQKYRGQAATFSVAPKWPWTALVVALAFGILRNLPRFL